MTQRICSIQECSKKHRARGWCSGHYQKWATYGDPLGMAESKKSSASVGLFWKKVDKKVPSGCWVWTGYLDENGYGRYRRQGKRAYAHRESYEQMIGSIPDGMLLDHTCHNPSCVNPKHLRIADHAINMQNRRGASKYSKTGVRNVHPSADGRSYEVEVKVNGRRFRKWGFRSISEAESYAIALRRKVMPASTT